jgi:hypothetical protein
MIECTVENASYQDGSKWIIRGSNSFEESFKYRDLAVGTYTAEVFVEDCVGNIAYASENFEIEDVYPPEITIISPEDGGNYSTFPEINVTTNEEVTLVYNLNGYNETSAAQLQQHVVNGTNILTVHATI